MGRWDRGFFGLQSGGGDLTSAIYTENGKIHTSFGRMVGSIDMEFDIAESYVKRILAEISVIKGKRPVVMWK
jgi:hypothetical protein